MIFRFSSGSIPAASDVYWQDFIVKKVGHMILFAILAILFYRALVGEGVDRKKAAISAVLIALIYGAVDEFHQTFTLGREARFRDTVIDGVGAGLAVFLIYKYISKLPVGLREMFLRIGIK
ncbi:MAG: VanZ family protein [Candidatus Woesebacteria bacterium GW2011_GWE1_41_24]|nr:MAG: VanZ family protein [Candidatus Woesebacteria bacterium GW2011_GWE1_41_24]